MKVVVYKKYVYRLLVAFFLICLFGLSAAAGVFYYFKDEIPPLSELKNYDMKTGSEVYDINNNLIYTFAVEKRQLVRLNEIPQYAIDALIATEDKDFRKHWGVDLRSNIRAIIIDVLRGSLDQGASTITQQLSRNLFLTYERSFIRKIKEIMISVPIERMYSKDEILEMYFNKVPFGPGIYGIATASRIYFNKTPKELTIAQAALIVGITQYPSGHYPKKHPESAVRRRNIVLKRMFIENKITKEQYEEAKNEELVLYEHREKRAADDYFVEHIRRPLEKKYGTTRLFTGGLKIYTTLDIDLQQYSDSVLNEHLSAFEEKNEFEFKYSDFPADTLDITTPYVQGAVLVMDAETGYVYTMIGGRSFNHSKFNRMTQAKRQPGSAFKPILYSSALENGYTLATVIKDEPIVYIESDTLFYKPNNYSRAFYGYTRMRDALKNSRNIYAIKMITDLGPRKVSRLAKRFGLTTRIAPIYSLAIGTEVVIPLELISGYSTFPNGGERVNPVFIRRIEDVDGKILEQAAPERIRVMDEKVAYLMLTQMKSVVEEGTAQGIRWRGYRWPAAGKTGTTDDFRDAWFIGYNKRYICGIWVGFDDNTPLGKKNSGATAALPPWPYIMRRKLEMDAPLNSKGKPIIDSSELEFHKPNGIIQVEISKKTGFLPQSEHDDTIMEYFIAGTEPNPLSDSLAYNFYPTMYRENDKDTLIFDLGGVLPDSILADTLRLDSLLFKYDSLNVKIIEL